MPKYRRNLQISFSGSNLTHFGGLYLVQQFLQQLNFRWVIAQSLRFRQRNLRYTVSDSLLAIIYPIILGLGRIESSGVLKRNKVFEYISRIAGYPNATTQRRFLVRFGHRGISAFLDLHDRLRVQNIQKANSSGSVIFDLDTTVLTVYGHQEGAKVGYNPKKRGRRSYHPLICFEGRTRDCWDGGFYAGDTHPANVTIPMLERCFAKLPSSTRRVRLRADSAFYDRDITHYIEEDSHQRLRGERSVFPSRLILVQPPKLAATLVYATRLPSKKSTDNPKRIALGSCPTGSSSWGGSAQTPREFPSPEGIFANAQEHRTAKVVMVFVGNRGPDTDAYVNPRPDPQRKS